MMQTTAEWELSLSIEIRKTATFWNDADVQLCLCTFALWHAQKIVFVIAATMLSFIVSKQNARLQKKFSFVTERQNSLHTR